MEKTMKIEGMMCPHCEGRVSRALTTLDGVESAVASHKSGAVRIKLSHDVSKEELCRAIEAAGYKAKR